MISSIVSKGIVIAIRKACFYEKVRGRVEWGASLRGPEGFSALRVAQEGFESKGGG